MAYTNTCRTAKAIKVSPPLLLRGVSSLAGVPEGANVKWPTSPAMRAQMASRMAPRSKDFLRPIDSMRYSAGNVPATETAPKMVWMTYGDNLIVVRIIACAVTS